MDKSAAVSCEAPTSTAPQRTTVTHHSCLLYVTELVLRGERKNMSRSEREVVYMFVWMGENKTSDCKHLFVINIWTSVPVMLVVFFVEEPYFFAFNIFVCGSTEPPKASCNLTRESKVVLKLTLDANSLWTFSCQLPQRVAFPLNDASRSRRYL